MNDLISRQAAIIQLSHNKTGDDDCDVIVQKDIETIKALPSTQPERKKGKWVGYDGDWLKTMCKCSECGATIDINEKYRNFFCYHCGADMRGEQDE